MIFTVLRGQNVGSPYDPIQEGTYGSLLTTLPYSSLRSPGEHDTRMQAKRVIREGVVGRFPYFNAKLISTNYKQPLLSPQKQPIIGNRGGGQNKQTYLLNIDTFKLFCIKAGTKKTDEIHKYYVKLENLLHETIQEECLEIKQQLESKNQLLNNQTQQIYREHLCSREILHKWYEVTKMAISALVIGGLCTVSDAAI